MSFNNQSQPLYRGIKHSVTPFKVVDIASPQVPYRGVARKQISTTISTNRPKLLNLSEKLEEVRAKSVVKVNSSREDRNKGQVIDKYIIHNEEIIEKFMISSISNPLYQIVEDLFTIELKAKEVVFWQDIPSLHQLISKRLGLTSSHSEGLVGFTFFKRETQIIEKPNEHPAYKASLDRCPADSGLHMLLFPLWDDKGNLCAVVQVTRLGKDPFTNKHEFDFIEYFTRKFGTYYKMLNRPESALPTNSILEMLQIMELEQFLLLFQKKMDTIFKCRTAEIWKLDCASKDIVVYKKTKIPLGHKGAGIVGEALSSRYPVNCLSNRMMSSYKESVDGTDIECVLAVPLIDIKKNVVHAIALRGGKNVPAFTSADTELLKQMAPFIILAINNIESLQTNDSSNDKNIIEHQTIDGIGGIIDLIVNKTTNKEILQYALEKMELLTHSDRSTLYTVDRSSMNIIPYIQTTKNIPHYNVTSRSIPALTLSREQIFNMTDAYEDIDFDSSIDLETGYKTKTLLSMPIINGKSEAIGVLEFLNRVDGKPFPNSDLNYVKILSMICGMILDNEKLGQDVLEATKELRTFLNQSLSLATDMSLQSLLADILHNLRVAVQSASAAIYLANDEKTQLVKFIHDGDKLQQTLPLSHGLGSLSYKSKDIVISNNALFDSRFVKDPLDVSGVIIKSVVFGPIITVEGDVIGVIEVANKEESYDVNEVARVRSFATLIAISLEIRNLGDISEHGNCEFEMNRWITDAERMEKAIPQKLSIVTKRQMEAVTLQFYTMNWPGIDLFRLCFHVFHSQGLLDLFKITAETFFTFIYKLRETFQDLPYHNWEHTVDVLQFVYYQVKVGKIDNFVPRNELLCLYIAALCHDAGHKEVNPDQMAIDEKDDSSLHCAIMINLLSAKDSNLFKNLGQAELKASWSIVMQLVTASDSINHFKYLFMAKKLGKLSEIDWNNEGNRFVLMAMLIKCGTVSHYCKQSSQCEAIETLLRKEFKLDPKKQNEEGLTYEVLKKIEKQNQLNRAKDIIAFVDIIALPIIEAVASMISNLKVNQDAAIANLEMWKSLF